MLTIKIDRDEDSREEIAEYLRQVAILVEDSYFKGEGWDLSGSEGDEEDDMDDDS